MRLQKKPIVDDKLVQQCVSQRLQSIWEADFLPNGYRPNKRAHQVVHSLALNIQFKWYCYNSKKGGNVAKKDKKYFTLQV